jgi:hypothetical protein
MAVGLYIHTFTLYSGNRRYRRRGFPKQYQSDRACAAVLCHHDPFGFLMLALVKDPLRFAP